MSYRKKTVGFTTQKVWKKKEYNSFSSLIHRPLVTKIIIWCLLLVWWLTVLGQFLGGTKNVISNIGKETAKIVAKGSGDSMVKDTMGNINVLLVWYAGEDERGWLLTDTVMVASYNPDLGTVTFLSIPRDLYVTYHRWGRGRLNGTYRAKYLDSGDDHEAGAEYLMEKITQITGIHLQYYAFVSFEGFVRYVDSLWWVTIDVPTDLNDPYYPDNNNGFQTFSVAKGVQDMDGDTALKYARSRKTTSDFSRTLRQQQIIKGMLDKIVWWLSITNIGKTRQMYADALDMVKTNISTKEILWLVKYLDSEKRFFSFVYTADCDKRYFEMTFPWCVLHVWNTQDYDGQSVLLPIWATPGNINYYKHTKEFAFWVVHNQEFLLENAPIKVLNGIDKNRAKSQWYNIEGIATRLAIDLKAQAFNIADIKNHDEQIEKSIIYVQDKEAYQHTVDLLGIFVDIDEVREYGTWDLWYWVSLVLGNDYVLKQ